MTLKPALMTLSTALEHEQLRCGYVSSQMKLASPYLPYDPDQYKNTHSSGLALYNLAPENETNGSSLAATLIRVFEGLSKHGTAHTMVNDWIDLPLAAYDPSRRHPHARVRRIGTACGTPVHRTRHSPASSRSPCVTQSTRVRARRRAR